LSKRGETAQARTPPTRKVEAESTLKVMARRLALTARPPETIHARVAKMPASLVPTALDNQAACLNIDHMFRIVKPSGPAAAHGGAGIHVPATRARPGAA
jgi:hypothetical protein